MSEHVDPAVPVVPVIKSKATTGGEAGASASVHVDKPLSDFSVQVVQEDSEFQARKIVSNLNSSKRQDMYYFYEPAYFLVNQVAVRAEGAEAARAKYGVARRPYTTEVYALKQPVTDETVANADKAIDRIYEDAARFVTRQFLLNKERLFAAALLQAGVWATDWTGQKAALTDATLVVEGGAFQKFNVPTSRPLDVLDQAMETIQLKSGMRPNTMVMTRSVFTALKRNSSIRTTKLYTNGNSGSNDAVKDTIATHLDIPTENIFVLDVIEVLSASATIAGADAGSNETLGFRITTDTHGMPSTVQDDNNTSIATQFIGGNGILLMHIDKSSNGEYSATAAVCAQWTGLYPDAGELGNTVFKRYRKEEFSAEFIEGRTAFAYHIVAPILGLYLSNVI